jgi:hypothetical protein
LAALTSLVRGIIPVEAAVGGVSFLATYLAVDTWFKTPAATTSLLSVATATATTSVHIWERNKELIRKRTDIGEHFTREVIQSIVFIFLPLGERVHLTNLVYYY